ncbi:MAG: type ISP restriction/modification enzyme [Desulfobaccales bacterium]|jgi:hypothetical protein
MPGKGKVITRDYAPEELTAIREGAGALGLTLDEALEHLGETTCDIYLNESAYWQNIPARVWGYYIGGYQVIKKWLSYGNTIFWADLSAETKPGKSPTWPAALPPSPLWNQP